MRASSLAASGVSRSRRRRRLAPWVMHLSLAAAATAVCSPRAAAQDYSVPEPAPAAISDSIRTVLDSSAAGWNRGDLAGYLSLYTEDVTSNGLNGFVHGKDEVESVMRAGFWKSGRPLQHLHFEHFKAQMLGSSYAVVTGEYVLLGANQPDRTGWFTTIWRRTREGWRCMHDHS